MKQYKNYWVSLSLVGLVGCMTVPKPSTEELAALDHPPRNIEEKIDRVFPSAIDWFNKTEAELHRLGRALTEIEQARARELGVKHPEDVRIVVLKKFPMPSDPELKNQAERYGLGSFFEAGRTMGHVIMLKPGVAENRPVLVHELVHVSQFDHMGRDVYLRRYIVEMEMLGYARAPMELEAYAKQREAQ
jgi:hypothetical protein